MNSHEFLIFTDGACEGNPGPGGWGALILTPDHFVLELGGEETLTTNNQMELNAPLQSLSALKKNPTHPLHLCTIRIFSDSSYVVQGMNEWRWGWKKRNWTKSNGEPVLNQTYWEELDKITLEIESTQSKILWNHIPAHSGLPANERVDQIAFAFSKKESPTLYSGPLKNYSLTLEDFNQISLPDGTPKKSKSSSSKKAQSYLSLVDFKLMRHLTWPECEARVKGRSGAKFKKCTNDLEEKQIAHSWGVSDQYEKL